MCEILLIYPPYSYPRKSPPLGLAYIASVLEKNGFKVGIFDMSAIEMTLLDLEQKIREMMPKLIGISFMTNQYGEMRKVADVVKKVNPSIPVVVGGPHASALPEEALVVSSIDFVVIGEGEMTMLELTQNIINKDKPLDQIKGLGYKKSTGGEIIINPKGEYVRDLDSLPLPAWHLLPVEKYSIFGAGGDIRKTVLPIISSRGCPNLCIFCDSHSVFGRCFRGRSAENIFTEIMFLKNTYSVEQFDFVDDTITVDKKRIEKLCQLILQNNLKIKWMCNARVNTVTADLLKLMKQAGCVRIDLGVESGDPRVLKAIKKGITVEQIISAHKMAQEAGLQTNSFVMVGNLEEDFQSVKKTADLIREVAEDASVAIATPFPGTELYHVAQKNHWIKVRDWSRYVTAPTSLPGYEPVMVTDKMNQKEILKSWYWLHAQLMRKKFRTRFGRFFFFNPSFYRDAPFRVRSFKELIHKIKMGTKLVRGLFKH